MQNLVEKVFDKMRSTEQRARAPMPFIRLTDLNSGEEVVVNVANIRHFQRHKDPTAGNLDQSATCIDFAEQSGQGGHHIVVRETLQEIIDKIDEAFAESPKDLSERNARYHASVAVRKLRRKVEYLAGSNRENRAI